MHAIMLSGFTCLMTLLGPTAAPPTEFRAGDESFKYRVGIGKDEQRGPDTAELPHQIKLHIKPLLEKLHNDSVGLKFSTELNVESFFTVADAFEADGRLAAARDVLVDLREKLEELVAARQGKPMPGSLIRSEEDILHYRDAHNIHAITGAYVAGGQPSEQGYRWLKSKGVTTVINLREASAHEKELLERLGIRYVHIAWPDLQPPTMEQARKIVATIEAEKKRGGKVFQHCLRGIGRDGTMVCCVRVASGTSAAQSIAEWLKVAPTWLDDQARDEDGTPVQLKAVRQFERELRGNTKADEQ